MRNDIYRGVLTCTDFTTWGRVTGMTGHRTWGVLVFIPAPPQKKK